MHIVDLIIASGITSGDSSTPVDGATDEATYLTYTDESADLPNSFQLEFGEGLTDSFPSANEWLIEHITSGATAGTYTFPSTITVNDLGHITAIASGVQEITHSGLDERIAIWRGEHALGYDSRFIFKSATGRLGIGTSSPLFNLMVREDDNESSIIGSYNYNGGNLATAGFVAAAGDPDTPGSFSIMNWYTFPDATAYNVVDAWRDLGNAFYSVGDGGLSISNYDGAAVNGEIRQYVGFLNDANEGATLSTVGSGDWGSRFGVGAINAFDGEIRARLHVFEYTPDEGNTTINAVYIDRIVDIPTDTGLSTRILWRNTDSFELESIMLEAMAIGPMWQEVPGPGQNVSARTWLGTSDTFAWDTYVGGFIAPDGTGTMGPGTPGYGQGAIRWNVTSGEWQWYDPDLSVYTGFGSGSSSAPIDAQYWVGAADSTLTAEKNLGALGTGLVKNTAGVPSIGVSNTDYASPTASYLVTDTTGAPTQSRRLVLTDGARIVTIDADGGPLGDYEWTISHETSTVTSGTYLYPRQLIIDAYGHITDIIVSGSSPAPGAATYITQTSNSELANEQALADLATGILRSTTGTGVISIATAGTHYVDPAITVTGDGILGGGGDLSTSRTITHNTSAITSGTYLYPTGIIVDTYGHITTIIPSGGGSAPAPSNATYITQTASSDLSAEQALGDLATGLLKSTTSTGVLSIAAAGTDFVAPATTITAGSGLLGGGDLSTNRAINVGAGSGIIVDDDLVYLSNTTVSSGVYSNPTIYIDNQGRITTASSGSAGITSIGNIIAGDGLTITNGGDLESGDVTLTVGSGAGIFTSGDNVYVDEGNPFLWRSPHAWTVLDGATVTVTDVNTLAHTTSNTPAAGYGVGVLFNGEDSASNEESMGRLAFIWPDTAGATHTTERSSFLIQTRGVGSAGAALATLATFNAQTSTANYGLQLGANITPGTAGASSKYAALNIAAHTITYTGAVSQSASIGNLIIGKLTIADTSAMAILQLTSIENTAPSLSGGATSQVLYGYRHNSSDVTAGASQATSQYAAIKIDPHQVIYSGVTNITSTPGLAGINVGRLESINSTAITMTTAAGIYINAAPLAVSNLTITNSYAFWSDDGTNRFDGEVDIGSPSDVGAVTGTLAFANASVTGLTKFQSGIAVSGVTYFLPVKDAVVSGQMLTSDASAQLSWSSPGSTDIQEFTLTSQSPWTKPTGAKWVKVICVGAGGGGGAGTEGAVASGGGAGGGGGVSIGYFAASDLAATESIVVGVGGIAGVVNGGVGGAGGLSSFGSWLQAGGGGAGPGAVGSAAGVAGGGGGGSFGSASGSTGGTPGPATSGGGAGGQGTTGTVTVTLCAEWGGGGGGGSDTAADAIAGGSSVYGGPGGGGGGAADGTGWAGGAGGDTQSYSLGGGGTAGTGGGAAGSGGDGGNGTNKGTNSVGPYCGTGGGGGGGAGSTTTNGGTGGNGGAPGAGAGGGGSTETGSTGVAKNGGVGGRGEVIVVTYF